MSATWAMGKALSELMARHGQTLPAPAPVAGSLFCASWRICRRREIERRGLGKLLYRTVQEGSRLVSG
jgi:hypothetical protein